MSSIGPWIARRAIIAILRSWRGRILALLLGGVVVLGLVWALAR